MRYRAELGMALVVLIACTPGTPVKDPISQCFVTALDGNWKLASMDLDVQAPPCPFSIPTGFQKTMDYFGVVTGDPFYIGSLNFVADPEVSVAEVRVYNQRDQMVNEALMVPKAIFQGSPPRAESRVKYIAGTYTPLLEEVGRDFAFMDIYFRQSGTGTRARAELKYTYSVSAVVTGPISVIGGSSITLGTKVSNAGTPLKYRWWRNGALMGITWSGFSTAGPATGTSVTYKVEVTDVDGQKGIDSHTISGGSSGGGGGGGGGGCLVAGKPLDGGKGGTRPGDNMEACPPPPSPQ
jgi:hypothetical protein